MAGPKKKAQAYQWSGEIHRVISLAGGTRARIQDEHGKSRVMLRDSDEFRAECARLDEVMDGKITRELEEMGWA